TTVLAVASRPPGRMPPFSAVLLSRGCADFFWHFTAFGGVTADSAIPLGPL
ncbi:hypothetical protein NDU88_005903, partial [Pleurodeles waltl]